MESTNLHILIRSPAREGRAAPRRGTTLKPGKKREAQVSTAAGTWLAAEVASGPLLLLEAGPQPRAAYPCCLGLFIGV